MSTPPTTPPPGEIPPKRDEMKSGDFPAASDEDRLLGMLAHLLGLLSVFGPLIIWILKKDESKFIDDQGKESLNFQISLIIAYAAVSVIAVVTCGIGAILYVPLVVAHLVMVILASIQANQGVWYRYPVCIRLVK